MMSQFCPKHNALEHSAPKQYVQATPMMAEQVIDYRYLPSGLLASPEPTTKHNNPVILVIAVFILRFLWLL